MLVTAVTKQLQEGGVYFDSLFKGLFYHGEEEGMTTGA